MRDQNGIGIMVVLFMLRYSREIAFAAVLGMAALSVWGIVYLWR